MARVRKRSLFAFAGVLTLGLLAAALVPAGAGAAPKAPKLGGGFIGTHQPAALSLVRTVDVRQLAAAAAPGFGNGNSPSNELVPANHEFEKALPVLEEGGIPTPTPSDTQVNYRPNAFGWESIDHLDQRFAGGGNQFSLEPPDQGLCVGSTDSPNGSADGTELIATVNDAIAFYDTTTHQFGLPLTLSEFFGLPPTINRTTGEFGPFISDPKCYFDPDTDRWFVTTLVITQDPDTGELMAPTFTYIAVSMSDEMLDGWFIYALDTTDANHSGCPCFGDQPLIGADANGFFVSTAEYSLDCFSGGPCEFNGPQIYALPKLGLESGSTTNGVQFSSLTHSQGGRTTGTVQPATSPNGVYDSSRGGTEYFLSGFDCLPTFGCPIAPGNFNEISVWAITNTSSLNTVANLQLSMHDMFSEPYGTPVPQIQRDGPRPLGEEVGEPVPPVNANDSRMNQVVYAKGRLWSGINTIVDPGPRDGIAWFQVIPSVASGLVSGNIQNQGYVAAANRFLSFPSIGVGDDGKGVMYFSLMGPTDFPSSAHVTITPAGIGTAVVVDNAGWRPEDGFTCYAAFGGGLCRWGDYSAAVWGPDGRIYGATERIGDNSRSYFANWSTFISPIAFATGGGGGG